MSTDFRQLMRPDLMSESALVEILKSRCIDIPNVKNLSKGDLVEMFRRVALPLPQRKLNEARHLGKKLCDLRVSRKISTASEEEWAVYESVISSQENTNEFDCGQIKASNEKTSSPPKKMCFTNSSTGTNGFQENDLKRKINEKEVPAQKEVKKRQKIMWP